MEDSKKETHSEIIKNFYNNNVEKFVEYSKKNKYYYEYIIKLLKFLIPPNKRILEIGCGIAGYLKHLNPSLGVGIDIAENIIKYNKEKYPEFDFYVCDYQKEKVEGKFDYIIICNTIGDLEDIWQVFRNLKDNCNRDTKIVIIYYNHLWEPILWLAEELKLKVKLPAQNWLNYKDIQNLLYLNGFEIIKYGYECIFPYYIPILSETINKIFSNLPIIHRLNLISWMIAKPMYEPANPLNQYSVSVIIPCKNERENIEGAVYRTPNMGLHTELIFVDGNSTDGTKEKILELIEKEKGNKDIKLLEQKGKGKADAVRLGFSAATNDVLMILDSDLTVTPEDLIKFYKALEEGKGEFINGSRLTYNMEEGAMRTINFLGNKFFALIFSFLLNQRIKDTLCGTKVLFKKDYKEIEANRSYFGDFDPFGDFDLLFGAAKNNLKIIEIPIRYKARSYGDTKISRFKHGWLLLKMAIYGFIKLKLAK
ncbi:MAG TPA: glycosyltransferase [bacterium]|nr:glycosyltransferase [bacterium]HOL46865.1 glycosyltransferase [bacterium]HPQ18786.1 glycosyltransferase [bacterium]